MGKVIVSSSSKGGCGKTTSSVLLSDYISFKIGERSALIDCDLQQHAASFFDVAKPEVNVECKAVSHLDDASILKVVFAAADRYPYVFVDLPGISTKLALMMYGKADLVVIPANSSLMDARDAEVSVKAIQEAELSFGRDIRRAVLWNRVTTSKTANTDRSVFDLVLQTGERIFRGALADRPMYRAMFENGVTPRLIDKPTQPQARAQSEVAMIGDEILEMMGDGHGG